MARTTRYYSVSYVDPEGSGCDPARVLGPPGQLVVMPGREAYRVANLLNSYEQELTQMESRLETLEREHAGQVLKLAELVRLLGPEYLDSLKRLGAGT